MKVNCYLCQRVIKMRRKKDVVFTVASQLAGMDPLHICAKCDAEHGKMVTSQMAFARYAELQQFSKS